MDWDGDATSFLESILAEMPFFIRSQAKTATREKADELASARDAQSVSKDDVIIAMIQITPSAMRDPLKQLLKKKGVEMARFEQHWT
jgi:hypothetical protein